MSGLVDAEGSFGVNLVKKESSKIGYSVLIYFEIGLKLWVEVGALQATVKKPEGYSD